MKTWLEILSWLIYNQNFEIKEAKILKFIVEILREKVKILEDNGKIER